METAGWLLLQAYRAAQVPFHFAYTVYSLAAARSGRGESELGERIGRLRASGGAPSAGSFRPLWIHAASLGEVRVAEILVNGLDRHRVGLPIHLTTMTRSGRSLASQRLGDRVGVGFVPFDFPSAARRFLAGLSPSAALLVETEIWPNLLLEAERAGIPVLIANGRLSDRSFSRYCKIAPLIRRALRPVRVACVQSASDGDRFVRLGIPESRIRITGSLKFSAPRSRTGDAEALLDALGVSPLDELWIAGSTAEGEEDAIIMAFDRLPPPERGRRVLVLAPRRPERFDTVAARLERSGLPWRRRSGAGGPVDAPPLGRWVILLDTLGELASLYPRAAVAFCGGSLVPIGGHNLLEPAVQGIAPIFGPHVENVRDIAALLLEAGAAFQVKGPDDLASLFARLAADPALRARAGAGALEVVRTNSHAREATLREILPYLPRNGPGPS